MKLSKSALIGYPAGIMTGVTYGLNPLFAMPLLMAGAAVQSVLFFRYAIAVVLLGGYMLISRQGFKVNPRQMSVLLALGLLYTSSSLCLFEAYHYIASGLATTLVFLYPVLVAIIMVFMGKIPSWPVWLSIAATFAGVVVMTGGGDSGTTDPAGISPRLCVLHCDNQPKQGDFRHLEQSAYFLCALGRRYGILRYSRMLRNSASRPFVQHSGMGISSRPGHLADHRLYSHSRDSHSQHRGYQGFRIRRLRTDHRHSCRCNCIRRTSYGWYNSWNQHISRSCDSHDISDETLAIREHTSTPDTS